MYFKPIFKGKKAILSAVLWNTALKIGVKKTRSSKLYGSDKI